MMLKGTCRLRWRGLRQDESGLTMASTITGALAMLMVLLGVTSTLTYLLHSQINLTAATAITNQMNQPSAALRSDATLAGNIPAITAGDKRVEFIIPGHQSEALEGPGCRVSIWEVRESADIPGRHSLVNTERIYAGFSYAQPTLENPVTPHSTEGASVCTGELVTSRETVRINDTGAEAGFSFFNGRGNELTITRDEGEVSVKALPQSGSDELSVAERAAHSSTRIEGVRYTGMVAESDERDRGLPLSIYAAAPTLEHKDLEEVAFGAESIFIDDITVTP